jgi:ATP-dependent Clp protease adapter protein ClpS
MRGHLLIQDPFTLAHFMSGFEDQAKDMTRERAKQLIADAEKEGFDIVHVQEPVPQFEDCAG